MMKKDKKHRKVIFLIGLIIILSTGGLAMNYWLRTQEYQNKVKNIVIQEPDLNKIEDGEYIGKYDVDFINVKVKVTVKNHSINNIKYIYHENDRGEKASNITQDILTKQKVKVDTISGATNSSKVIQKAVELALTER